MHTSEDYRNLAKYHMGRADALDGFLRLYRGELPDHMYQWAIHERGEQRREAIDCYNQAIKLLKEGK